MYRDKEVGVGIICDRSPLFKWNVAVVLTRIDDLGARNVFPNELTKPQSYIQAKILFKKTLRPHGTGVISPMTWIDSDASDFQS